MHIIRILFQVVDNKWEFIKISLLSIITAILDVFVILALWPILVFSTQNNDFTSSIVYKIFSSKIENQHEILLLLNLMVLVFAITTFVFRRYAIKKQLKYIFELEQRISIELLEKYLSQEYVWFKLQNSSKLVKNLLIELYGAIQGFTSQLLIIISQITVLIILVTTLLIVNPFLIVISCCFLGLVYIVVIKKQNRAVEKLGKQRVENNETRQFILNEIFRGFKELKIYNLNSVFIKFFSDAAIQRMKIYSRSQLMIYQTRYSIDLILSLGIIFYATFILIFTIENNSNTFYLIGLSLVKIIPSTQQLIAGLNQMKFSQGSAEKIVKELELVKVNTVSSEKQFELNNQIVVSNLYFKYPNDKNWVIDNLCFKIDAYSKVGLIGSSGSGKSTIADLLMGMLSPKKGTIQIDGTPLNNSNKIMWQKVIGYVPQKVFLFDATIEYNITLMDSADKKSNIDYKKLSAVCQKSGLTELIDNQPNGLESHVGENGNLLSGGQIQRIGIARALYKNPKLLILDEITSALDSENEKHILNTIKNIDNCTIVYITHKLETLYFCDNIINLNEIK